MENLTQTLGRIRLIRTKVVSNFLRSIPLKSTLDSAWL